MRSCIPGQSEVWLVAPLTLCAAWGGKTVPRRGAFSPLPLRCQKFPKRWKCEYGIRARIRRHAEEKKIERRRLGGNQEQGRNPTDARRQGTARRDAIYARDVPLLRAETPGPQAGAQDLRLYDALSVPHAPARRNGSSGDTLRRRSAWWVPGGVPAVLERGVA